MSCCPGHAASSSLCSLLRSRSCNGSGSFGQTSKWPRIPPGSGRAGGEKRDVLLALRHLDKNPERRQNYFTGEAQRHLGCHPQRPNSSCHQFREDLSGLMSLGGVTMSVSDYSLRQRHHLFHRLLRCLPPRVVGGDRTRTLLLPSGG